MSAAHLDELFSLLRFPSVSTDPERKGDVASCAEWLVGKLRAIGLKTMLHPTAGHPIVVARNAHRPDRRTVMIYGHYDVQPVDEPARAETEAADPNKHWTTPPFTPTLRDGVIYGRGVADNKGPSFSHVAGIADTLREHGDLPVNLILLIEGEEEIGSTHLEPFLSAHRDELRCDIIAISDTGMVAPGVPTFTYGLRGITALEVRVTGAASDLHSGIYGGVVANPATALARLLASLHDAQGRVAVPGFYDEVAPLAEWEREAWARLPLNDAALQRITGAPALFGEAGYSGLERAWARPTIEVNGIGGGFQGVGSKTVIPREAFAKLTCRLVPHQEPKPIAAKVTEHLHAHCPPGVRLQVVPGHGGPPYLAEPQSPHGLAAQRALRRAFPNREVALIREGGSIPIVNTFKRVPGSETLLLGLALPDCRAHAPNENLPLENFEAGIRLNRALLEELAGT
jgi:acetylornithine deacetylase/succinyl-diaminopimelate desuccinylase-like protein